MTPTQHTSKRTAFDTAKSLWGSWLVENSNKKFWFAGDTAYCSAFKHIGDAYGPIDLAAIPIGAYNPRWFMKYVHVDPDEAVEIHKDIRSKQSVGIHWATWILTGEPIMEPEERLEELKKEQGLRQDEFITLKHGESKVFE